MLGTFRIDIFCWLCLTVLDQFPALCILHLRVQATRR
jgi:hypothetical protein